MTHKPDNAHQRILTAFRELVLARPYAEIHVTDIVALAGVSRSTFYENFKDKRSVLVVSMSWILDTLCDAMLGQTRDADLQLLVSHIHENRDIGRILFNLPEVRHVTNTLATMLSEKTSLTDAACHGMANAHLGVLKAWVSDDLRATDTEIVDWLKSNEAHV